MPLPTGLLRCPAARPPGAQLGAARSVPAQERTLKKYTDDILRVLEAVNIRMEHLEASHERLAGTVTDLRGAVTQLKDGNNALAAEIVERAAVFQGTLETAAGHVQALRDKQARAATAPPG